MGGVEIFYSYAELVGNQSAHLRTNGKDTDFQSVALDDDPGFRHTLHRCSREVVVRAKDGEVGLTKHLSHVLQSEVEFVIAYGRGVNAHLVHQSYLHITFEHREIGRALEEVARVEIQQVGMFGAFLF